MNTFESNSDPAPTKPNYHSIKFEQNYRRLADECRFIGFDSSSKELSFIKNRGSSLDSFDQKFRLKGVQCQLEKNKKPQKNLEFSEKLKEVKLNYIISKGGLNSTTNLNDSFRTICSPLTKPNGRNESDYTCKKISISLYEPAKSTQTKKKSTSAKKELISYLNNETENTTSKFLKMKFNQLEESSLNGGINNNLSSRSYFCSGINSI